MKKYCILLLLIGLVSCGGDYATFDDIDLIPLEDPETRTYSYYGLDGQKAIDGRFEAADFFSDGLAKVRLGKEDDFRNVFIDRKGHEKIDLSPYEGATGFWNGFAWALRKNGAFVALAPDGEEVFEVPGRPVSMFNREHKALVQIDEREWAIVDGRGRMKPIPTEYEIAPTAEIHADRLVVNSIDGDGVIDLDGRVIVPPGTYSDIRPFDVNGYAVCGSVLIDRDGREMIGKEAGWDHIDCDGENLYLCSGGDFRSVMIKWCDPHGTPLMDWPNDVQYWQNFAGGEYAFFHLLNISGKGQDNIAMDRQGEMYEINVHMRTPVVGKCVALGSENGENAVRIYSPDGTLLNIQEFYLSGAVERLVEIGYLLGRKCYGFPYVSTSLVLSRYDF